VQRPWLYFDIRYFLRYLETSGIVRMGHKESCRWMRHCHSAAFCGFSFIWYLHFIGVLVLAIQCQTSKLILGLYRVAQKVSHYQSMNNFVKSY